MSVYAPIKRKLYTLIMPLDLENKRILLGYKKRGFGMGKYNGFGGKVEENETILEGAIRELQEESCIKGTDLSYHGILFLEAIADATLPILEIHVFAVTKWEGEPAETDEMRPEWYSASPDYTGSVVDEKIPFTQMWEETAEWLPLLLSAYFGKDGSPEHGKQKQLVHHATFGSAINPETGLEDVWHGMLDNYFVWVEDEEGIPKLEGWESEARGAWVEERRKRRFGL
ncbi:unnamed protein product [Tuber aestivum]|uniref:Oxidized purine nucleoside triphosphate hydrolase n=1 Tax=Tuber aestivum TaxID=59557 RepID=A0A292Q7Z6_9PEZI|nr:unnamed protein product [Tuber aestivum]